MIIRRLLLLQKKLNENSVQEAYNRLNIARNRMMLNDQAVSKIDQETVLLVSGKR